MCRTDREFQAVKRLVEQGLSDYKIAAVTGLPRATVLRWRHREKPPHSLVRRGADWVVDDAAAYCYLLGAYLGDGHVLHPHLNTWSLRITCDRRYPEIVDEVRRAMETTFCGRRSTKFPSSGGAAEVVCICHPGVGIAFPQHGPGRKHDRPIVLTDWQLGLTHAFPGELIRGLIHSDGCRVINRFSTKLPSGRIADYSYVRYFFTNYSPDIRQIFIDHCGLLGVRVTQSNHRNLTVAHRKSVAILEELVGPKG